MNDDHYHKMVTLPALFNNNNLLEYSIEPDKRFLVLGKCYLQFQLELPVEFVPDNNFGNKLFEYLDLNVQYEDCSFKCSTNDYDYTSHVADKIFRNPAYLNRVKFEGHYDNVNYDSSELKSSPKIVSHRRGEKYMKTITVDGKVVTKEYYRYFLMLPINHGLCRENQVLPAGVHVRLSFHRANAKKALVDISNEVIKFPQTVIPLIEPVLQVCWAFSPKLTQDMSKISSVGLNIPFESGHIRHRVLDDGLMEHNVQIIQGQVPKYMAFFLMEPDRFANDFKYSSTKMERHGLTQFSLVMDNETMQHYPLKVIKYGTSNFYHQFYRRWLQMTDRYEDNETDIMDEETYINSNFIILETFEDLENKEGHLAVKLNFDSPLENKLLLCWLPVTQKTLQFDRNLSVHLT